MKKTAILPIISAIYIAYEAITGQKITTISADEVATIGSIIITAGITVWGIIKNHKKGVK